MAVFYVLLLVPILMQNMTIRGLLRDRQKRNRAALKFFFVFLTLLIGLRHETIGNDTYNYKCFFVNFDRIAWDRLWKVDLEIGFCYFNKLITIITKDPQAFLMIAAIITSALIWPTYKRLCTDVSLTIVLFCIMSTFVMMFSGVRQMLAIGIGFIAYGFTRQKKLLLYILTCLVAFSVHTSAFMLAFMYPLYHAKVTKKWLYVVVPLLALCFVFNRQIFGSLTLILEKYTKYDGAIESTGAYTMLVLFGMFLVFSFLIPDERKLDKETTGLRNFLLLTFALQMFAPLHTTAMRMGYYYMIYVPLLLPKIIEVRSKRWNQVAILGRHVMVAFFLVYFFLNASSGNGGLNVFPYHFFWEIVG